MARLLAAPQVAAEWLFLPDTVKDMPFWVRRNMECCIAAMHRVHDGLIERYDFCGTESANAERMFLHSALVG
jgi:hypothetical protein